MYYIIKLFSLTSDEIYLSNDRFRKAICGSFDGRGWYDWQPSGPTPGYQETHIPINGKLAFLSVRFKIDFFCKILNWVA